MSGPDADPTAPIIIVGAGRSGTTRLNAVLGAHRDVYMIGETSFLLPKLWATITEVRNFSRRPRLGQLARQTRPEWQALSWAEFRQQQLIDDAEGIAPLLAEIESAEGTRMQRALGAFFAELMIAPPVWKPRWGFKEIWAGGDAFPYDWDLYRAAFPEARFVQSVRHPIDYVRSMFSNMGATDVTEADAAYALGQWVTMVRHARRLRDTGRYVEFRMEDFDEELPRILEALDLSPDPACLEAARHEYLPSARRPVPVPASLDSIEGLRSLAEELDYALPER
jgi:hypothetical protein